MWDRPAGAGRWRGGDVGWLDRVKDQADELAFVRRLLQLGQSAEALDVADKVLATTSDSNARADAAILRLNALVNLGHTAAYSAAVNVAFDAVHEVTDPYPHGQLHALVALGAHHQGALERCVTHLVLGARALGAVEEPDADVAWAWHDLAMAYSYLGFHGWALGAIEHSREVGAVAGVPDVSLTSPGIRLRVAVSLDHAGDTEGCLRVLRDLTGELTRLIGSDDWLSVRPPSRAGYGYALTRRAALGEQSDVDALALLRDCGDGARSRDLRQLGEVCLAIAGGRPIEALTRLESVTVAADTAGPSETARLRALAYQHAGDHAAAHRADRRAFRLAAQRSDWLRDVYVEGIAARLAHEDLRRTVARYADEALTDPLTGLPNRRHLEQYVAAMVSRGERAVVGVADLDGFKAVNTRHGHHAGDLVLQRIAAVIARVMRRGDFVARYGGDEFVVVLPGAGLDEAGEVARRIIGAVGAEDWHSVVPGTPVGVSVGWAEVAGAGATLRAALTTAFEAADRAMLRAKAPRAAS
jgi:diguanylate cyclase (GGDEF)-like protein